MKFVRILLPVAVVSFGFFVTTSNVTATPELSKKEKTGCKTCHDIARPSKATPGLNKVGDCYKATPDMKKCKS
jgi:hypothetical protein